MTSIDPGQPGVREGILDLLALLADPERQRTYERTVPIAHVPAELVCMWFDDQYHPDAAAFRRAFSAPEAAALEEFSRIYRLVAEELEPLPANLAELQAHPAWGRVRPAASAALKALGDTGASGARP